MVSNNSNNNTVSQENKKRNDKSKTSSQDIKSKKVFPLILSILEIIFCGPSISNNNNNNTNNNNVDAKTIEILGDSNNSSVLILNRISAQSNYYHQNSSDFLLDNNDSNSISESIIIDLYEKLYTIWEGMVLDSSLLLNEKIFLLTDITKIIIGILKLNQENNRNSNFFNLLKIIFNCFPYICVESSLAAPGSVIELSGRKNVSVLNVSICEIIFTYCSYALNDIKNINYQVII
jgi:hypothetical protein